MIADIVRKLAGGSAELPHAIHESVLLTPADITFSQDTRAACEANLCGRYGKCWTCPPGVGDFMQLRDHFVQYHHAFVYTTVHDLEDSFDFEGMEAGRQEHDRVDEAVIRQLKDTGEIFELAGAGSCTLCPQCTYPDAPCRHPEYARRSMEACGIDVVTLSRESGLHYINGVDTVTYFSVVFW